MHHAVVYEHLVAKRASGIEWPAAIQGFCLYFKKTWPFEALGDPEEEPVTFSVNERALSKQLDRWNSKFQGKQRFDARCCNSHPHCVRPAPFAAR